MDDYRRRKRLGKRSQNLPDWFRIYNRIRAGGAGRAPTPANPTFTTLGRSTKRSEAEKRCASGFVSARSGAARTCSPGQRVQVEQGVGGASLSRLADAAGIDDQPLWARPQAEQRLQPNGCR